MDSASALHMLSGMLWTGLMLSLPILLLTMLVGVLVSVLQVITQIQEMSLTFVPKLVTAAAVLVICGPWMLRKLMQFSITLWSGIPALVAS